MQRAAKIAQIALRGSGVLVLLIGFALWSGHGYSLRQAHMVLGAVVVLSLWALAGLAAKAAPPARVIVAVLWGFIVLALGMTQTQILPGAAHWLVRVMHLLVGIGALAQGERLARAVAARATGSGAPA
jgi:ABC-type multidrug transport system permease subunit